MVGNAISQVIEHGLSVLQHAVGHAGSAIGLAVPLAAWRRGDSVVLMPEDLYACGGDDACDFDDGDGCD